MGNWNAWQAIGTMNIGITTMTVIGTATEVIGRITITSIPL
jgi:hypothetical protein